MKRSNLIRKPSKVKGPSCNHPERSALPLSRPVAPSKPKKRANVRNWSPKRQKQAKELSAHIASFPDHVTDPSNGRNFMKCEAEFHHPAGRRKAAFLFVVPLLPWVHAKVHADPKWAESVGLLWSGRNSKEFTPADAWELLKLVPHPVPFRLAIELWEKSNATMQATTSAPCESETKNTEYEKRY